MNNCELCGRNFEYDEGKYNGYFTCFGCLEQERESE